MTYIHEATVEGAGTFPVDMLRHDGCHPTSAKSVDVIVQTNQQGTREPWKVELAAASSSKEPLWTKARWKSFGARITKKSIRPMW